VPKFSGSYDLGELRLTKGRNLDGAVVDAATGAPVERAIVEVGFAGDGPPYSSSSTQKASSDHQGHFRLQRVDGRASSLSVTKEGYLPLETPLSEADRTVTLSLEPGAAMHFTILDGNGKPARGHVSYGGFDNDAVADFQVSDGSALISGLGEGRYYFDFFPDKGGGHYRPIQRTLKVREVVRLDWREATDGATVKLELVGGDLNDYRAVLLAGAEHATEPLGQSRFHGDWALFERGQFSHIAPGEWTLRLQHATTQAMARVAVKVTAEPVQTLTVTLPQTFEKWPPFASETP
jgi:hypothetical protein